MRLDINLASQPYEDARQFWLRWGTAVAGMGILTLLLLTLCVTGWFTARRDRATIAKMRTGIAERDAIRQQAEEFLNRPENRTIRDESQILNQLIERKSFSWTRVLEDMERVMPARVHLVSIDPSLDEENQLELKMVVAGDSRDKAIELVRRMEESRCFAQTNISSERYTQAQAGADSEAFELEAIYVPCLEQPAAVPPAKTEPKAELKTESRAESNTEISRRSTP